MNIIPLNRGDEARLRKIRLRSLLDAPDAFGSTHDEVAARPSESWTTQIDDLTTFLAVVDGNDVGIVRGCRDDENPKRMRLLSMWVDPAVRGKGVGDALVHRLVEWARTTDATELVLEVGGHNAPARWLYLRMGFEATGHIRRVSPPRDHLVEHEMVFRLVPNP